MAQANISQAFLTFMDRAALNPLDVFDQLDLGAFVNLAAIDLDEPDVTTVSPTSILGRQGTLSVEFKGTGFAPVSSFEAFSDAVENGTVGGTLTGIEVRDGDALLFGVGLTGDTLTLTGGDRQLIVEGSFPTTFGEVLDLIYAVEVFADEFDFTGPAEQAQIEALLARYSLSTVSLREGDETLAEFNLWADKVEVALDQNVTVSFNGSFAGGLGGDLASLGLVTSVLTQGAYYDEDGISLDTVVISDAQEVPFFTATGPFAEGDFLDGARLFVAGREMAYFELGSGTPGQAADRLTVEQDSEDSGLGILVAGFGGPDKITGGRNADMILGGQGNDRLSGLGGNDTVLGGDGTDVIVGGDGDDMLSGGATAADLRDVIYGGAGNDQIDGGHGNDELRGDAGNDEIAGGFGADTVIGGAGNDTLTGSAFGDLLFGGDGNDFINGGFGFDQVNGGAGADLFYHLGVRDHGADFIQDFTAADGDALVFGNANATRAQFQINEAFTPNAGADDVAEAFVIYRPTGQIIWALIDGMDQDEINLRIGGETFDLMA